MAHSRRNPAVRFLLPACLVALAACGEGDPEPESGYADRMAEEHEGDRPVATDTLERELRERVEGMDLVYGKQGGHPLIGFLARPKRPPREGTRPGLLVIHEWWGLNDNIRTMGLRLADQGYTVLAVDLFHGHVAETPDSARSLVRSLDAEAARENLRLAYRFLRKRAAPNLEEIEQLRDASGQEAAGASRIGVIGWCFGGGWSLRTALMLPEEVDATVIYYGRLVTDPARLSGLRTPVLGHFGAEDGSIPLDRVRRFATVLDSLGVTSEVHVYEGAGHAFANPSGTRYEPDAAREAWRRTLAFLRRHLMLPS